MPGYLTFPTDHDLLVDAIDISVDNAKSERNIHAIGWFVSHYYLQGYRNFDVYSWDRGGVNISRENRLGELKFVYEGLLYQYRVEIGRLMRMNVDPIAGREGFGLDSVRDSGIGQAVLSYMTSRGITAGPRKLLGRLIKMLVKYGTGGLYHYRCKGEDFGDRTCAEVVPPWELLSMPWEIDTLDDLRGVHRNRKVPLDWVRTLGLDLGRDESQLEIEERAYGAPPSGMGPESDSDSADGSATSKRREQELTQASKSKVTAKKSVKMQQWVELTETFLYGPQDYLSRRIVKVGKVIGKDEIYIGGKGADKKIVNPLPVCRYVDAGGFYGRSFVGSQVGISYEVEKMLANQFQQVSDLDAFPFLVIPTTSGLTKSQVLKRERRKVLFAEPDPISPNYVPYKIDPYSTGDFPGKIAQMGIDLSNKLSGQSDILHGDVPGRVDSAAALGFLFETANVNEHATVNDIADCFTSLYASFIQAAKQEVERPDQDRAAFRMPILDDRMIGVVFNPQTGDISIEKNPIPDPWKIKIDVAERALQSPQQEKQEALLMLVNGILSISEFKILNEKNGWNYPIGNRSDWEAWRKAVYQKIILYNDGETPGQIIGGSEYDRADIVLPVIAELMSSIEYMVASTAVIEAFIEWKERFEAIGAGFPDNLSLDEAATSVGLPTNQGPQASQTSQTPGAAAVA